MIDRLSLFFPLAWRNLWRNPRRTFITLAIVAIGMWSILVFSVVLKAWAMSSRDANLRVLTGEGQIHAARYVDDPNVSLRIKWPDDQLVRALSAHSVAAWAPRVRVPAVIQSEYRTRSITFLGVAPQHERAISDLPSQTRTGRYLLDSRDAGIVIGRDLVHRLKTRLGKRLIVMAQAADGHLAEAGFTIVGVFDATRPAEDEYAFTGIKTAQALLGIQSDISEISFASSPDGSLNALIDRLKGLAPSLDVEPWTQFAPLAYAMESFSQSYIAIWLMIVFALMAIGIVNAQLMAVYERTREFGLLLALGMRPGLILLQVTLESALLVGVGVVGGIALTLALLIPFRNGLDLGFLSAGSEMYGAGRVLYPAFDPLDAVRFGIIVWLMGIFASLWPSRTASRSDPVAAMGQL
jgi:ABC-type lipoprotein release transport system permease subunit